MKLETPRKFSKFAIYSGYIIGVVHPKDSLLWKLRQCPVGYGAVLSWDAAERLTKELGYQFIRSGDYIDFEDGTDCGVVIDEHQSDDVRYVKEKEGGIPRTQ